MAEIKRKELNKMGRKENEMGRTNKRKKQHQWKIEAQLKWIQEQKKKLTNRKKKNEQKLLLHGYAYS